MKNEGFTDLVNRDVVFFINKKNDKAYLDRVTADGEEKDSLVFSTILLPAAILRLKQMDVQTSREESQK